MRSRSRSGTTSNGRTTAWGSSLAKVQKPLNAPLASLKHTVALYRHIAEPADLRTAIFPCPTFSPSRRKSKKSFAASQQKRRLKGNRSKPMNGQIRPFKAGQTYL